MSCALLCCIAAVCGLVLLLAVSCAAQTASFDWQKVVRERLQAHDIAAALQVAAGRLNESPQDVEARTWHARLLAWSGQPREAETEYRIALVAAPRDGDILVGLASVLSSERRFDEALQLLKSAETLDPRRVDVYEAEGRAYRGIGQTRLARAAYLQALALAPNDAAARAGLASLATETRYLLSLALDSDNFNYTGTARAYTTTFAAKLTPRWSTNVSGIAVQRFGQDAARFIGSGTARLTQRDSLTAGAGLAHDEGVIPKREVFFEYGRGFPVSSEGLLRGIETSYHQHWFWYQAADAMALTPRVQFDLSHEWSWALQLTEARSHFAGLAPGWRPSGLARLDFPIHRPLSGDISWGVGTENFALVDQVGRFSARSYAGGLRYRLPRGQEVAAYGLWQKRSQGRTQTSYGVSYAIHY